MGEKIPEIYKAIAAIVNTTGAIPKTGYNDYHEYAYTKEEDIVNALKKQFEAHEVVLLPNVTKIEKVGDTTLINVEFTLMSLKDGSKHVFNVPGEGSDKGDKGTPKALTMAIKYALSKQFLVASGDDAEADTSVDARVYGSKSSAKASSGNSDDLFSRGSSNAKTEDESEDSDSAFTRGSTNAAKAVSVDSQTGEVSEQEDVLLTRALAATSTKAAPKATIEDSEEAEAPQVTSKASDILSKWKNNKTKTGTTSLARRA